MSKFDVWIIRFEPQDSSPAERLQSAFGIDASSAQSLERSVPKIVKHAVSAKAAGEMRQALEAIGTVVECRPARDLKPVSGSGRSNSAQVFHPPGADLFPAGRLSAIDPFASSEGTGTPRISVDDAKSQEAAAAPVVEARTAGTGSDPVESSASKGPSTLPAKRVVAAFVIAMVALLLVWALSAWRERANLDALEAARRGDRAAAEDWVDRYLSRDACTLHEASTYLSTPGTRQYVRRPDYVETFVEKLHADGAPKIEICDSDTLGYRFAHYLVVTLPDDASKHEQVIADAQSLVRRDAVVYRGVSSAEVEEIVRASTLVGSRRVLAELPTEAD
jgi:hypothetical protein